MTQKTCNCVILITEGKIRVLHDVGRRNTSIEYDGASIIVDEKEAESLMTIRIKGCILHFN